MNMKRDVKWLILALLAIAQFMVVLDVAIVNVALPALRQALHFSAVSLPWVVTAYALPFGGFLLLGGRAADLFGRRRVLLAGMLSFTIISLLIGLSQSAGMLIGLRALQGLAAAFMSPAALSLILTTFREQPERNVALSVWTMVSAGGAAVGLLVGGVLTQYVDWRWNFFINVPIGLLVAYGIYKVVPIHAGEARNKQLDLPGAALVTTGLMTLVFAISQAPEWGWVSGPTLGLLAAAAALLAGFVYNEARAANPLMPLSIFKVRNLTGANLMMAPVYAAVMGMFFLTTLYMQGLLHLSPVETAVRYLPFPIIVVLMARRMPRLVARFGYKPFLMAGPLLMAIGVAWLMRLPVHGSYLVDLLPSMLLIPFGMGMTFVPLTIAATSGVPANESGLASGLLNTSQQVGGALGLALLTGIATATTQQAQNLGPALATIHGDHRAFLGSSVLLVLAAVLGTVVVKQRRRPSNPEGGAAPARPLVTRTSSGS